METLIPDPNAGLLHNGAAGARLAAATYFGENILDDLAQHWDVVKRFENANASGMVGWHRDSDVAFIAVAGTNDKIDAINDLDARKVMLHCPDGSRFLVHHGFLEYARAALNGIRMLHVKQHLTSRHLYFFGHSLGGPAVELIPLLELDFVPQQIHTFGAPRWCASEHSLDYPYDTVHWRKPLDIVPDVPLHLRNARFFKRVSGFSHVRGTAVWLTDDYASPDTDHIVRRIQRTGCYAAATLRAFASVTKHKCLPGRITLEVIRQLNQTAADHHQITDYHRLIDQQRQVERFLDAEGEL